MKQMIIVGVGMLATLLAGATAGAADAPAQYEASCKMCHDTGMGGAPKRGDKTAWEDRVKKGKETLYDQVKNGFGTMPPRGMCESCTDDDLKALVDYLLSEVTAAAAE
ncbi:MAG TPA: c-type cytochrome [Steroidobacteraceae bacterium]|nr:c-type cytochrome [Steroidobacteraceae bacterium]